MPRRGSNHDVNVAVTGAGVFTFTPNSGDVTVLETNQDSIVLKGAGNFTFVDISFDDDTPFCWSVQDGRIVIIDKNPSETTYKYVVKVKITASGMSESHVHDVSITKEAPNYRSG